jgi:hypothetical protein
VNEGASDFAPTHPGLYRRPVKRRLRHNRWARGVYLVGLLFALTQLFLDYELMTVEAFYALFTAGGVRGTTA